MSKEIYGNFIDFEDFMDNLSSISELQKWLLGNN
jgi:hypothetical protein